MKKEKKEIILYFSDGNNKIIIEYELDENIDDYIYNDFINHWSNQELFFIDEYNDNLSAQINGCFVNEINLKKVVAISYRF